MSTRYAHPSNSSPSHALMAEETVSPENRARMLEVENSVVLTGNSTPIGGTQETGSWVSVSPNTHASDSDFEAYHGDNDDDVTFDSPFEDEAVVNEAQHGSGELEALRASLSTLLATAVPPKFRQARAVRDLAVKGGFLSLHGQSPPLYENTRDVSLSRKEEMVIGTVQGHDQRLPLSEPTYLGGNSLESTSSAYFSSTSTKPSSSRPIIHHRTSAPRGRGDSTATPYQDKAQEMIERSFNVNQPRMVCSAPASPSFKSSLVGGNPYKNRKTFSEHHNHPHISDDSGSTASSKSKKRKSSKKSVNEAAATNRGRWAGRHSDVSSLSLSGLSDYLSESLSATSESRKKSINRSDDKQNMNDGNGDDGKWYSGDITVKVWTAAVISGVLLGAGFGAGTMWRGSRGGHYATASA